MANISVTRKESLFEDLERLRQRVAERAHELFVARNGENGDALGDWLAAEREFVWKPSLELSEADGAFTVVAALPDVQAKDLFVDISGQDLIVRAETSRSSSRKKGSVQRESSMSARLFESIRLPKAVNTAKATAVYQRGVLKVTVPFASKVIDIKAA